MASRKDYQVAAAVIHELVTTIAPTRVLEDVDVIGAAEVAAVKLADYYGSDNPRFDREMFMTACGFPYTSDPWEDQR